MLIDIACRFGKFEPACERIVESLEGTPGVSGPVTIKDLLETPAWQVPACGMLTLSIFVLRPQKPVFVHLTWLVYAV